MTYLYDRLQGYKAYREAKKSYRPVVIYSFVAFCGHGVFYNIRFFALSLVWIRKDLPLSILTAGSSQPPAAFFPFISLSRSSTLHFLWNNENYLRPSKYSIRIYPRDAVQGEDAQVAFTTNKFADKLFRQVEPNKLTSLSLNSAKLLFV